MFSHGERGGPMASYLVTAHARSNFKLVTNTSVDRVVRDGSRITGVELSAFLAGGQCGTVNVTPKTGKVILSAGAFGTPKILFRSGIGPEDQLEIVKKAEGSKVVNASQWINLPVGYNLDDHTDTDITLEHPDVSFYDFYAAYTDPIPSDKEKYLNNRTGILTQSAPNLSVLFWEEIEGEDGITRQLQYTARVESSHGITSNKSMTISQYLGRGATSRGRTTINGALDMTVSQVPYLNNKYDLAAVKSGLQHLIASLGSDPNIKIVYPAANTSLDDFLAAYPLTTGSRSANHWMGSAKMGLDDGRKGNGTTGSVVDTNAKVYGTDNLFVVDASIFPGLPSTNPSALIVSVAEHASQIIGSLDVSSSANRTVTTGSAKASGSGISSASGASGSSASLSSASAGSGSSSSPGNGAPGSSGSNGAGQGGSSSNCTTQVTITRSKTATASVQAGSTTISNPIAVATSLHASYSASVGSAPFPVNNGTNVGPTASAPSASASAYATGSAGGVVTIYHQCGGSGYSGSTQCDAGLVCKDWNPYCKSLITYLIRLQMLTTFE
jgi:cellobiose dehydrogenase (acceptor)